jgi:5'-nucleotidase
MSPVDSKPLIIGISARALFSLEKENTIFEADGVEAYRSYQLAHEDQVLEPGTAFHLVSSLLNLNHHLSPDDRKLVEVVIMSRNSPDLSLRIFKSMDHYGLDVSRAAFSSGQPLHPYFKPYEIDLYLSRSTTDAAEAINQSIAAAVLYAPPKGFGPDDDQIRIAFDGDAVIFSEEAEAVYKADGLDAFIAHERENAGKPLPKGPFAKFLMTLAYIQNHDQVGKKRLSLALVTARGNATHERVIRTLREWGVHIDQAFFMMGKSKKEILEAFRPHIYFDDQDHHGVPASEIAPSGKVPYRSNSPLRKA